MFKNIKSAGISNKNEKLLTSDTKAVDVKVEISDDEVQQSEIDLYSYNVTKEEMAIGHEVLQHVDKSNCSKETHSESRAETSEQSQNQNESIIKLETEEMSAVREELIEELYADHEIKDEMVIGPVVVQAFPCMTKENGEPHPKKPRLETRDENTKTDNTAKETKTEPNTEEMTPKDCNENTEPSDTEPIENVENKIAIKSSKPRNDTQKNMKNDKNNKRTKNVFQCNVCAKQYDRKPDLVKHIESHGKSKRDIYFKCKECTHQSVTQCSLERHLKLHDKSRRFVCDECGYRFNGSSDLRRHLGSVHSSDRIHECGICDYKASRRGRLNVHLRIHSGEKRYSCLLCEFKSTVKGNLERHLLIHTAEMPYSCSECDYKCNSQCHLKRHLLIHTGVKPYWCSLCESKFSNKSDLKRHSRIHTGERPYSCSECDYKCNSQCHLKRHLLIHTGVKPYWCSLCKSKFSNKSDLKRHSRIHTGERPYSCSECNYKCSHSSGLKRHLKTHKTHSESRAETSEQSQNQNGSIIKLETDAMSAVREEPTEELYADHEIKDEMVIGPVVLQAVTSMMEENGESLTKKLILDTQDKTTEPGNTAKQTRTETNTEEMTLKDCNENTEPSDAEPMENVKNKIPTKTKNVLECNDCAKQYDKQPVLLLCNLPMIDRHKIDMCF